ncbi:hypothetical protein [Streptomyces sp. 8ZJF_21]|uniref:hypothetical protein n=1 Tax=Streptomyces sp. 8ZJF_21 TaxID=2903141 RepID=UPI001E5C6005|nr:hypothetical protein [Streptomyces sp. 8ZJF_21]MCD9593979.1 hypothetical protein [Streptomyces sp. 8ZJF_21]
MGDGISGLIGAAIGGLLAFAGAFWTGRNQGRTQHEQWLRQVRRDAYAQFITQAEKAHQLGHEADDAVRAEEADAAERIEELARAAYRVREAATLVALEGPKQIALDASNIQIGVDRWVHGRGLLLVESLATRWGIDPRHPCGKTVWAEIQLSAGSQTC